MGLACETTSNMSAAATQTVQRMTITPGIGAGQKMHGLNNKMQQLGHTYFHILAPEIITYHTVAYDEKNTQFLCLPKV